MSNQISIDDLVNWYLEYYGFEKWRPIDGVENTYEISSLGRLKSLPRIITANENKRHYQRVSEETIVDGTIRNGYRVVRLSIDDEVETHLVSRLVAKAFPEICGKWFEGCEVHHKDGDPFNNIAQNLQVVTRKEHQDIHKRGLPIIIEVYDNEWTFIKGFTNYSSTAQFIGCSVDELKGTVIDCNKLFFGYHLQIKTS